MVECQEAVVLRPRAARVRSVDHQGASFRLPGRLGAVEHGLDGYKEAVVLRTRKLGLRDTHTGAADGAATAGAAAAGGATTGATAATNGASRITIDSAGEANL